MKNSIPALISLHLLPLFVLLNSVQVYSADWNPLPDTGQTTCYDMGGTVITCPATGTPLSGQDAQYNGPPPAYTDNSDGTVTDGNTGLVWQQNTADTDGSMSITSGDEITWQAAVDYCDTLSFASYDDWRLPTSFELHSIVDYGRSYPAIHPVFTTVLSSSYWSATTYAPYLGGAWTVYFEMGFDFYEEKTYIAYVRCVRGGL